jgi:hypothetical protein
VHAAHRCKRQEARPYEARAKASSPSRLSQSQRAPPVEHVYEAGRSERWDQTSPSKINCPVSLTTHTAVSFLRDIQSDVLLDDSSPQSFDCESSTTNDRCGRPFDCRLAARQDALTDHSDRGSQHASEQFQRLMADSGILGASVDPGKVWGQRGNGEIALDAEDRAHRAQNLSH